MNCIFYFAPTCQRRDCAPPPTSYRVSLFELNYQYRLRVTYIWLLYIIPITKCSDEEQPNHRMTGDSIFLLFLLLLTFQCILLISGIIFCDVET